VSSDQVVEFLEFVEGQKNQSVGELLDKVLRKSRLMTGAEAGTIFITKRRGRTRWLVPASVQNDAIKVKRADFIVPIGPGTIAGHVADKGRTLRVDDVYSIPKRSPYRFDATTRPARCCAFRSRTCRTRSSEWSS
jgi:hypothetical protein